MHTGTCVARHPRRRGVSAAGTRLFVHVVDERCCGVMFCAEACPEVFKLDGQGFAYVDDQRVPDGLEDKARVAAKACPERAIEVSEVPFG